jgi:hypothetical protein
MTLTSRASQGLLCDPTSGSLSASGPARAEAGVDAGTAVKARLVGRSG